MLDACSTETIIGALRTELIAQFPVTLVGRPHEAPRKGGQGRDR